MMRDLLRAGFAVAIVSLLLNIFFVVGQWRAVSLNGSEAWLWVSLLLVFPMMAALACVAIAVLFCIPKWSRRVALNVAVAGAVYFVVALGCLWLSSWIRIHAFADLAVRSEPLVNALHEFEKQNGEPPRALSDLVPRYIASVPTTGMGAYPTYEYAFGDVARSGFDDNPWVLWVSTPSGAINWDIFIYYPRQNYPANGHGGQLERVERWAYVHE